MEGREGQSLPAHRGTMYANAYSIALKLFLLVTEPTTLKGERRCSVTPLIGMRNTGMSLPKHDEKNTALRTVINLCHQQHSSVFKYYGIPRSTLNNWLNRDDHIPFTTAFAMSEDWGVRLERLMCSDERDMTKKAVGHVLAYQALYPIRYQFFHTALPPFVRVRHNLTAAVNPCRILDITGEMIAGYQQSSLHPSSTTAKSDVWRVDWQGFLMGYPVFEPLFDHLSMSDKVYCGAWRALALCPFASKQPHLARLLPSALRVNFHFTPRYRARLKQRTAYQSVGFAHPSHFLKALAVVTQGDLSLVQAMDQGTISLASAYAQLKAPVTNSDFITLCATLAQSIFSNTHLLESHDA